MGIVQDPKRSYPTLFGSEDAWVVKCDKCGKTSIGSGIDPGEAAEKARKEGFKTVPRGPFPADWVCNNHQK